MWNAEVKAVVEEGLVVKYNVHQYRAGSLHRSCCVVIQQHLNLDLCVTHSSLGACRGICVMFQYFCILSCVLTMSYKEEMDKELMGWKMTLET